jgi:hypothetical protein
MKNIVNYLFLCIAVFALVSCNNKSTDKKEAITETGTENTVRTGQVFVDSDYSRKLKLFIEP